MRYPLLGKAVALGAVALALMASLAAVSDIVSEREGRLRQAELSVMDSLASQQTLVGPVLQRQCEESWDALQGDDKDRRVVRMQREFTSNTPPQTLNIKATTRQEPRYRGIYKVNGYAMKADVQASFLPSQLLPPSPTMKNGVVVCKLPTLWLALSDTRGLGRTELRVGQTQLPVLPGTRHASHPRGFHAVVPEPVLAETTETPLRLQVQLELLGTAQLAFAPTADDNQIELTSDWPHPSFAGRSLPGTREVTDKGFSARWQVSALATSAGQQLAAGGAVCALNGLPSSFGGSTAQVESLVGGVDERRMRAPQPASGVSQLPCIETLGVSFMEPVSSYVLSDRATKYGLLFIALTFVGVALVEVQRRLRVHPIQYLLVGFALVLFFLMLVSLSEHLAFTSAYVVASTACTLLLTLYGRFVLGGLRPGLVFGTAIAALYGALYMLLQLEQSALVLGSMLLFVVLAAVMMATRHMDWYAFTANVRRQEQSAS
jgi:inner membrane protein